MVQILNEFFCDGKPKMSVSIERIEEVFRYFVFGDTIQSIEGVDRIKKEWFLLVKANGIQDASKKKKKEVQ